VAVAIAHCLGDRDRYRRMSEEAARIARAYSLERWRDDVRALLEEAWGSLDDPGRRAPSRRRA